MPDKLTPEEVRSRIEAVKGQLQPLGQQIQSALVELAGLEQLLEQVAGVRKPDLLLRAVEENLRALVVQLNAVMHLTLPPREDEEEDSEQTLDEDEALPGDGITSVEEVIAEELSSAQGKTVSVQPQGARFITLVGEIHRITDIPRTFGDAAASIYESKGGLDAPIRIAMGGQRQWAHVPLRFVLARGGGFLFWKNIQAARRTLGELYKTYGKNQIRKSDPVSPAARKMHNRTRGRGLDRVDEVLARWEASIESDAARFRIEVMSELIVRFLTAVFDDADVPETRDDAFVHAFDAWQNLQLIISQYGEESEPPKTFLRSLEADIDMQTSHFVDSLGWVITQIEIMRQGGSPPVSGYIYEHLQTAFAVMHAGEADRWVDAVNVLWRRYKILEADVAGKVTKF